MNSCLGNFHANPSMKLVATTKYCTFIVITTTQVTHHGCTSQEALLKGTCNGSKTSDLKSLKWHIEYLWFDKTTKFLATHHLCNP